MSFAGSRLVLPRSRVLACVPIPVGGALRLVSGDAAHLAFVGRRVIRVVEPDLAGWQAPDGRAVGQVVLMRDAWRTFAVRADAVHPWLGDEDGGGCGNAPVRLRPAMTSNGHAWVFVLDEALRSQLGEPLR